MRIMVTGGAGFMGSDFIRYLFERYKTVRVLNVDKLTYCGNLNNLVAVRKNKRYKFAKYDIADKENIRRIIRDWRPDAIVNFAAETHVDRSILDPMAFVRTDIFGTYCLLEAVKEFRIKKYIQISTDEVYGPVKSKETAETAKFNPTSPYSASKAGADHLVSAYIATYNLPAIITHATNNYGPHQYPEKLIPLLITNLLENKNLPIYGKGLNVREWLFVRDHSRAIDLLLRKGKVGESYNIGSGERVNNLSIAHQLLKIIDADKSRLNFIKDRPGHDIRYAVNYRKIQKLGWRTRVKLSDGLKVTVNWYKKNQKWWRPLKTGSYLKYYKQQYQQRLRRGI